MYPKNTEHFKKFLYYIATISHFSKFKNKYPVITIAFFLTKMALVLFEIIHLVID